MFLCYQQISIDLELNWNVNELYINTFLILNKKVCFSTLYAFPEFTTSKEKHPTK